MRSFLAVGTMCAAVMLLSCGTEHSTGSEVKDRSGAVNQVNPKSFNAFNIWRDGQGSEILEYPQGYDVEEGSATPDGVFYEERHAYYSHGIFQGIPTSGASVASDILVYPAHGGRTLKLKFSPGSPYMKHSDAVRYCKEKALRLPTVRELFDFCVAGTPAGPHDGYPHYPQHRCGKGYLWSASVRAEDQKYAWMFFFLGGSVDDVPRYKGAGARCVGPAD